MKPVLTSTCRSGLTTTNQLKTKELPVNAKKCKAIRKFVGDTWRQAQYNTPPLVPIYARVLNKDGLPTDELTISHYKTDTVTLVQNTGRNLYRQLKTTYRNMRRPAL